MTLYGTGLLRHVSYSLSLDFPQLPWQSSLFPNLLPFRYARQQFPDSIAECGILGSAFQHTCREPNRRRLCSFIGRLCMKKLHWMVRMKSSTSTSVMPCVILLSSLSSVMELQVGYLGFPINLSAGQWPDPNLVSLAKVAAPCAFRPYLGSRD